MSATFDVAAFQPTESGGLATQAMVDATTDGRLISGGEQLAQRFTCRFGLEKGTVPYLPKAGCLFVQMLRVTGMSTEEDVFTAFAGAMLDLRPQLQAEESGDEPDNERFGSAQLLQVTVLPSRVELLIKIVDRAGNPTTFTMPLQFSVQ